MAATSPSAVIPPNVRIGVKDESSSTLKPMTITTQVATMVGPVWRSVVVSAPTPSCALSRYSWAKKLVSSTAIPSEMPMMNTVAMSMGQPMAPSSAPIAATGRTLTNMALAASVQSRSETKNVAKHASAMIRRLAIWPREIASSMLAQRTVTPDICAETCGTLPKCRARIDAIFVVGQLFEPGVVEIGKEHHQPIRIEPVVHVAPDLGIAAGQREDVGVRHGRVVGGEAFEGLIAGEHRRDLGKDLGRSDDFRHLGQRLDLGGGRADGVVQSGVDRGGRIAPPDDNAQLRARQAGGFETRVVLTQPFAGMDHVEIRRIVLNHRDQPDDRETRRRRHSEDPGAHALQPRHEGGE